MAFPNLTDWARKNLKRSEILQMIEELQALVKAGGAESEEALDGPPDWKGAPIPGTMRRVGEDSRRRYQPMSREAEAEFMKMFPDAGRLK
jgi:hypothetical protein